MDEIPASLSRYTSYLLQIRRALPIYQSFQDSLERRIHCSTLLAEGATIGARRGDELCPEVQGRLPVESRSADARDAT
jgi:hypothetical protein